MALSQLGFPSSFVRVLWLSASLLAVAGVLPATAQTVDSQIAREKFIPSTDISLGIFGQLTPSRVPVTTTTIQIPGQILGTAITQTTQGTSPSAGVVGTFHQSLKPWLGYNVNMGYSRFSENYSQGSAYLPTFNQGGQVPPPPPPLQNYPSYTFAQGSIGTNMYELTVAYAVQGPKTKRFSTFAQLGGGSLIFLPTQDPAPYAVQIRATMVFGVGMNYRLSEHFALRAEYRGLFYKNPDYLNNGPFPVSKLFTVTNEPTLSVVYNFGRGKKKSFVQMY